MSGTGIEAVARASGVSTATVSRALRGLPGVSDETRARVLDAARVLQYVASPSAATLASGRTRCVGVVLPWVDRWYFSGVLDGISQVLGPAGFDMLVWNLRGSEEVRRTVFTPGMLSKRVDGVLVVSLRPTPEEFAALQVFGHRVASIGSKVAGWGSVTIDDVQSARMAAQHLLSLGHHRIALVGGATSSGLQFDTPGRRMQGFSEAMQAAGAEVQQRWVVPADYAEEDGYREARMLLASQDRPTALLLCSDEMAFGALRAVRALGLSVPDDVSIMGIDDHDLSASLGLTTVAQDVAHQGRVAALALLAGVHDPLGTPPASIEPLRLVVRGSTGAPPAG